MEKDINYFDFRPSKMKLVLDGIGFESEESRMESPNSKSTFQKSNDLDTDTGTTSYWSDYTIDTSSNEDDSQAFGNYFPWVNTNNLLVINVWKIGYPMGKLEVGKIGCPLS